VVQYPGSLSFSGRYSPLPELILWSPWTCVLTMAIYVLACFGTSDRRALHDREQPPLSPPPHVGTTLHMTSAPLPLQPPHTRSRGGAGSLCPWILGGVNGDRQALRECGTPGPPHRLRDRSTQPLAFSWALRAGLRRELACRATVMHTLHTLALARAEGWYICG
jgi:hypothetical protein